MTQQGISDIDSVITTRELVRLIKMYGIDITSIEPEPADKIFVSQSPSGKLANVTGGTAEAAMRTFYKFISNKEMTDYRLALLRGSKDLKKLRLNIGKHDFGIAVVNGMSNVKLIFDEIASGKNHLHYVEVMACPGGCIAGGGQPIFDRENALKTRTKTIYELDEKEMQKAAHKSEQLNDFYENFLNKLGEGKSHSLFHTTYSKRDVLL
jgi:iron only hydrogenase large subunit-like protein